MPSHDENAMAYAWGLGIVAVSTAASWFLQVRESMAALRDGMQNWNSGHLQLPASQAVFDAAIIAYNRPFTRSNGVRRLESEATGSDAAVHAELRAMRNKAVAHSDSEGLDVILSRRDGALLVETVSKHGSAGASRAHVPWTVERFDDYHQLCVSHYLRWRERLESYVDEHYSEVVGDTKLVIAEPVQVHEVRTQTFEGLLAEVLASFEAYSDSSPEES